MDGWWGLKSAFVHPECGLAILKKNFINKLLESGFIKEQDIDTRNQVSHIELISGNDTDKDSIYNEFNGRTISLNINSINIRDNFIELDLGKQKHFTLIYFKGIKNAPNLKKILESVLEYFAPPPAATSTASASTSTAPTSLDCVICMENERSMIINPCGHVCVCEACSRRFTFCPICKIKIIDFKRAFIS